MVGRERASGRRQRITAAAPAAARQDVAVRRRVRFRRGLQKTVTRRRQIFSRIAHQRRFPRVRAGWGREDVELVRLARFGVGVGVSEAAVVGRQRHFVAGTFRH